MIVDIAVWIEWRVCAVCSVQCTVCSVQCAVYSVQCAVCIMWACQHLSSLSPVLFWSDLSQQGHGAPGQFPTSVLVRTLVEDGDIFEVLGTNRIRADDGTPAWHLLNSLTVDLAPASAAVPANSIMISCPYNCQLSSQQNVYLRTDTNNTNIQTESFNAENTDVVGATQLSSSRILGRMIIDNDFVNFTTGTQMEYFVNLTTRQPTFLRLYITDSHGRPIPLGRWQTNSPA